MVSIPTDDQLAQGTFPGISFDDMAATSVPSDQEVDQVVKGRRKRRVRGPDGQLYDRDDPRLPPGFVPTRDRRSGSDLDKEQERLALRKSRRERYEAIIKDEINPYLIDLGSMFTGIPKQAMVQFRGDDVVLTPLGQQIAWNDTAARMHATTIARLQETERGQQMIESLEGASPYLFMIVSGLLVAFWFVGLMGLRQAQMAAVRSAMAPPQGGQQHTNGQAPGSAQPGGGLSFQDIVQNFFNKKPAQPTSESQEEVVVDGEQ